MRCGTGTRGDRQRGPPARQSAGKERRSRPTVAAATALKGRRHHRHDGPRTWTTRWGPAPATRASSGSTFRDVVRGQIDYYASPPMPREAGQRGRGEPPTRVADYVATGRGQRNVALHHVGQPKPPCRSRRRNGPRSRARKLSRSTTKLPVVLLVRTAGAFRCCRPCGREPAPGAVAGSPRARRSSSREPMPAPLGSLGGGRAARRPRVVRRVRASCGATPPRPSRPATRSGHPPLAGGAAGVCSRRRRPADAAGAVDRRAVT